MGTGATLEEDWEGGSTTLSTADLLCWLRDRIANRMPGAVVRFGDGELYMLQARPDDGGSLVRALRKLKAQTGCDFSDRDVLEIKAGVVRAYEEADVMGIHFDDKQIVKERVNAFLTLYDERVISGKKPAGLAHCHLHHHILDRLPGLLAARSVSVVSCRNVAPVLEADWGLEDVAVYQVPSQHVMRDVDDAYEAALHGVPIWPDTDARIREELTVRERGEIFLIGAGVFGKDLCIEVRERGGLALDLGSALDRLVGKITRGPRRIVLDLHRKGLSIPDIADSLEDRFGLDRLGLAIDQDKLRQLTGDAAPRSVDNPHELAWLLAEPARLGS